MMMVMTLAVSKAAPHKEEHKVDHKVDITVRKAAAVVPAAMTVAVRVHLKNALTDSLLHQTVLQQITRYPDNSDARVTRKKQAPAANSAPENASVDKLIVTNFPQHTIIKYFLCTNFI